MKKNRILFIIIILFFMSCTSVDRKIHKNSKKEEYYLLRGINYTRQGDYIKGLKEYEKAYNLNQNNILVLKELGKTYVKLEEYDRGIFYYSRALKLNGNDQECIKNLGYIYFLKNELKESLEYINRLSARNLDFQTLKLKSYLLHKNKEYKKAYDIFNNILSQNSEFDLEYFKIFIETLKKLNKNDELRLFLESNRELYEGNKDYIIFYSYSLSDYLKEYDLAEKEIKRHIVSYGGDNKLYTALAYIKYKQKDYDKANLILKLVSSKEKYDKYYLKLKERLEDKT